MGANWPLEPFIEQLLTGLATAGLKLMLASTRPPPASWLASHQVTWRCGPERMTTRQAVDLLRRSGPRAAASAALSPDHQTLEDVDVIYVPWINALTEGGSLRGLPAPIVTSCRGSLVTSAPWNPEREGHRVGLPRAFDAARLVHCVSDRMVQDAGELGLDPQKARVIRPAVDPGVFRPRTTASSSRATTQVLSIGTLSWPKDHEHAILAIRLAVDRGADVTLDIIGDGPELQHLRYAIGDLGLDGRVRLLGRRTRQEVAEHLHRADAFLHTSSSEGISNAVLEAMASGLPVITTDAGGMTEAVTDGIEGFVVGVRDARASADRLVVLDADSALRSQMGAAARARVLAEFQLQDQIEQFAALLHEAAGR